MPHQSLNTSYTNSPVGVLSSPKQQQQRRTAALLANMQHPKSPMRHMSGGSYASSSADSSCGDDNHIPNSNKNPTSHLTSPSTREQRERNGLCIQCGEKLFEIKKSSAGLFRSNKDLVKIPLSIPGVVERGQCLTCGTRPDQPHQSSSGLSPGNSVGTPTDDHTNVEGVPNPGMSVTGQPTGGGRATYTGEFNVYGERDGQGTMKWENGDSYTGSFFNGNRHGPGTLHFADGSEYVGEWECNLQHGIGTRRWTNGDCYTGQYINGKRTGEGRFYFSNGDMYTGHWEDGVMDGFGRYYYSSGQRFEGTFRDGKRRGKGKLQRTDGSVDIGVYHRDVRVGLGVRWNADRTVAWKMLDGTLRKKISIAEAVAMDYDIDAAVLALDHMEQRVV